MCRNPCANKCVTSGRGRDRQCHVDGPAAEAGLSSPHGVAVSPDGTIAVAEAETHTIRLIRHTDDGDAGAMGGRAAA